MVADRIVVNTQTFPPSPEPDHEVADGYLVVHDLSLLTMRASRPGQAYWLDSLMPLLGTIIWLVAPSGRVGTPC